MLLDCESIVTLGHARHVQHAADADSGQGAEGRILINALWVAISLGTDLAVPRRALSLRAGRAAACRQGPSMQYSPVPSPEGTKETYWETKAPSSEVLGIGSGVSSGTYITASVVAAIIGGFCTGEVTAELSRNSLQGFWSSLAGCGGVAPAAAGVSQREAPGTDLRACGVRD